MAENIKQTVEARAQELLEPLVAGEGLELLEVEFVREREGWVLRLFIDKPGGRVGLDECSQVSRAVDTMLDVEDIVPHEYNLEVSSPGLNRPLKKPQHFERVRGQQVKVKTFGPIGEPPRKNFKGTLTEVAVDAISVDVEGAGTFRLPFKDIAKANLEFEF
ncbi:MAG TPA: ribosome maturation factor RimP [Myxococcaceae bacterium]|nr:ribosome maturation factor RimP [Myxococcaceae bacterium]